MNYEDTEHKSLVSYIDAMHEQEREVVVYVEGDLKNEPPLGNAAAVRVAHLLCDDSEKVERLHPEQANETEYSDDIGAVQIELPLEPIDEQWREVQARMLSRVPRQTDVVLLVDQDEVPWYCRELADIRIVATGIDKPLECYRVKFNPYSGDTYYHELPTIFEDNGN